MTRLRCTALATAALLLCGTARAQTPDAPVPAPGAPVPPPALAVPPLQAPPSRKLRFIYEGTAELQKAPLPGAATGALAPVGEESWRPVCAAPCDATAELGVGYRVGGSGLFPSALFVVSPDATEVVVDTDPGRKAYYWTGVGLIGLGAVAMLVGAGLFFSTSDIEAGAGEGGLRDVGSYMALGSPVLLIAGGVLWGNNRETVVSVQQ